MPPAENSSQIYAYAYLANSPITNVLCARVYCETCRELSLNKSQQCNLCLLQHTTYVVPNLSPKTEYQFRVSAINIHGFSDPGPPSDVIVTLDKSPVGNLGQFIYLSRTLVTVAAILSCFELCLSNIAKVRPA